MRIGVDVDDVLFPWYDRAHRACEAAGITNGVTPQTWQPFDEYGCGLQPWLDALKVVTLDGTLYAGEPYPGAAEQLDRLRSAGHTVHLVTARGYFVHGDLIRSQTVLWLAKHGIPHDSLTFSRDKTLITTDWFVDDSADNIDAVNAAGSLGVLVTRPWNEHSDAQRVETLEQFVELVLS